METDYTPLSAEALGITEDEHLDLISLELRLRAWDVENFNMSRWETCIARKMFGSRLDDVEFADRGKIYSPILDRLFMPRVRPYRDQGRAAEAIRNFLSGNTENPWNDPKLKKEA